VVIDLVVDRIDQFWAAKVEDILEKVARARRRLDKTASE
jgi:hypothetical protein